VSFRDVHTHIRNRGPHDGEIAQGDGVLGGEVEDQDEQRDEDPASSDAPTGRYQQAQYNKCQSEIVSRVEWKEVFVRLVSLR
jgi:hypothetical protein